MSLRFSMAFASLRGLEPAVMRDCVAEALRVATATSGLDIEWTDDPATADIRCRAEAMTGSTLAYAFLPNNDCHESLAMRFNSRVAWDREKFLATLIHELGHTFGLSHAGNRDDIMYWQIILGRTGNDKYGPVSAPQLVTRYGGNDPTDDPDDSPQPPKDEPNMNPDLLGKILDILVTGFLNKCLEQGAVEAAIVDDLRDPPPLVARRFERSVRREMDVSPRKWRRKVRDEVMPSLYAKMAAAPTAEVQSLIEEAREEK
ncbi:MAG: matrixin family metalloprotease [bacterium]|nr:matrixin family metalloprotease [bacterium]